MCPHPAHAPAGNPRHSPDTHGNGEGQQDGHPHYRGYRSPEERPHPCRRRGYRPRRQLHAESQQAACRARCQLCRLQHRGDRPLRGQRRPYRGSPDREPELAERGCSRRLRHSEAQGAHRLRRHRKKRCPAADLHLARQHSGRFRSRS